jgi:hypothetical protein
MSISIAMPSVVILCVVRLKVQAPFIRLTTNQFFFIMENDFESEKVFLEIEERGFSFPSNKLNFENIL